MKNPIRIGIEAQRLFRQKKHGMDIVALEMIRHLQEIDQENQYFIFVKPDADSGVIKETSNFKIVEIPGGPYPVWEQIKLPAAARHYDLDVLHCTSNTAPLKPGVPLVLTLHDIIYLEQLDLRKGTWYQRIGNLYRRWNVPRVVPACTQIITVSEFERERILHQFGLSPKQVSVVYNSAGPHFRQITDPSALAAIRTKYNLPAKFIFFLANTDPKKNLRGVLAAMALLKKENKLSMPLVMLDYEEAHLTQLLSEVGAPDLRADIQLCGYVPNQELPYIYNLAQLFLYPSLRESFGIPILEAMACGTPVITSHTASMPEVAGDAALLVNPFEPQTIADAILKLQFQPELTSSLTQKGLSRAAAFSWFNTAQQVKLLYQNIASSK